MDAPASPFLDAGASDLGEHTAVALAGVLKGDPERAVHTLTLEIAGVYATKDALPTPLLDALGVGAGVLGGVDARDLEGQHVQRPLGGGAQ